MDNSGTASAKLRAVQNQSGSSILLLTQKKIHQNKKRIAHGKDVLSAIYLIVFSSVLLRFYSSYPQKFQRPFLFTSLFESFRYHEYQTFIIFALVKNLPVTELPFFVLVDNPEEPVNTNESSTGLPYCGFICKCYRGIDIEEEGIGWVEGGGGEGKCLLVISP